jgi:DNA-binding NarL/FixJ family response regulator
MFRREAGLIMRLFVVDDAPEFRATLRRLLEEASEATIVGEAPDGEAAIEAVPKARPDVVLMDLAMPRMNGLEATRRLKLALPDLRVVILTVHDDETYRRTALAAGADAFLPKKTVGVDLWPTLQRLRAGERLPKAGGARGRREASPQ